LPNILDRLAPATALRDGQLAPVDFAAVRNSRDHDMPLFIDNLTVTAGVD